MSIVLFYKFYHFCVTGYKVVVMVLTYRAYLIMHYIYEIYRSDSIFLLEHSFSLHSLFYPYFPVVHPIGKLPPLW